MLTLLVVVMSDVPAMTDPCKEMACCTEQNGGRNIFADSKLGSLPLHM